MIRLDHGLAYVEADLAFRAGRLDCMLAEALAEYAAGKVHDL